MLERLISFTEPESGAYGVIAVEGEHSAAALTVGESEPVTVLDECLLSRGEGTLRLESEAGILVVGLAARTTPLAFETAPGSSIELQPVGASVSFSTGAGAERGFEATGVSWALAGEGRARSLRTLWGLGGDGLLAMFALRDTDSSDHGSETVGAVRISADGKVLAYDEPLLSTEYDDAGHQVRATLELWGEDGALADRGGGLRRAGARVGLGESHLEAAAFSWSLGGKPAAGAYEIYTS